VVLKTLNGQMVGQDYAALVALALSIIFIGWSAGNSFLRAFAGLGSISFAVYALGTPMIDAIRVNGHLPTTPTWASYVVRIVFLTAVLFPASWLLERRIQPTIKQWILGRH